MSKFFRHLGICLFGCSLLSLSAQALPISPTDLTVPQWLAVASAPTFTLRDPNTNHDVESYTLKPGWKGFGEVTKRNDITGANTLVWYSGFSHPKGAKAYLDSTFVLGFAVPYSQTYLASGSPQLAKFMSDNLTKRAHVATIKNISLKVVDSKDPKVLAVAKGLAQQNQMYMSSTRIFAKEAVGEFTFTKDGQNWNAKCRVPILVNEARSGFGNVCSTYVILMATLSYIYPANQPQLLQEASAILQSRQIDKEWEGMTNGLRNNISNNAAEQALKRSNIINQTQDDLRNMRQDSQRQRDAAERRMSQKRSDATLGQTTVQDPFNSGKTITVSNKLEHIWVNANGEQCGSNSSNYNPNSDKRRNSTEWRQVK